MSFNALLSSGFMIALLVLMAAPARGVTCEGRMCGDCDGDSRVTIDELVAAVGNALGSDACGFDCSGECFFTPEQCRCGDAICGEFPRLGEEICEVSLCYFSDEQLESCTRQFKAAHPERCHSISGTPTPTRSGSTQ
jgi:hypothetical protein